eukprot:TRINITY_DN54581_c0_g2_i1.p1 TRINITY_DN54581_c0_g2~~TRINITY_DN54581_c0_g2_i1.p1  ORF type:complete len:253 (-),score=67.01 TRINITY_DN54581_c0_g2_i1:282-1040(-)
MCIRDRVSTQSTGPELSVMDQAMAVIGSPLLSLFGDVQEDDCAVEEPPLSESAPWSKLAAQRARNQRWGDKLRELEHKLGAIEKHRVEDMHHALHKLHQAQVQVERSRDAAAAAVAKRSRTQELLERTRAQARVAELAGQSAELSGSCDAIREEMEQMRQTTLGEMARSSEQFAEAKSQSKRLEIELARVRAGQGQSAGEHQRRLDEIKHQTRAAMKAIGELKLEAARAQCELQSAMATEADLLATEADMTL